MANRGQLARHTQGGLHFRQQLASAPAGAPHTLPPMVDSEGWAGGGDLVICLRVAPAVVQLSAPSLLEVRPLVCALLLGHCLLAPHDAFPKRAAPIVMIFVRADTHSNFAFLVWASGTSCGPAVCAQLSDMMRKIVGTLRFGAASFFWCPARRSSSDHRSVGSTICRRRVARASLCRRILLEPEQWHHRCVEISRGLLELRVAPARAPPQRTSNQPMSGGARSRSCCARLTRLPPAFFAFWPSHTLVPSSRPGLTVSGPSRASAILRRPWS